MGDLVNFVFTDMSSDLVMALEFVGFVTVLYLLFGFMKILFGLFK